MPPRFFDIINKTTYRRKLVIPHAKIATNGRGLGIAYFFVKSRMNKHLCISKSRE